MIDTPSVGLRAWSEPDTWQERAADQRNEQTPWSPPASEPVLVLDTETTIDHAQALLVGGYRVLRLDWREQAIQTPQRAAERRDVQRIGAQGSRELAAQEVQLGASLRRVPDLRARCAWLQHGHLQGCFLYLYVGVSL